MHRGLSVQPACICFKSFRLWVSSSRTRFCSARAAADKLTTLLQQVNNPLLCGFNLSKTRVGRGIPDDELEKLRSNLLHAYDKRKPLTRRIIEAVKARAPRKTREHETKKKEDAA
jgi:hypothetical protein